LVKNHNPAQNFQKEKIRDRTDIRNVR